MNADIFCRVVDNYGDIGVTWRLARQLQQEHHACLRLWVDDLASFKRLEPRVTLDLATQRIADIDIVHWTPQAPDLSPRRIAIASFSCDLPANYIAQMSAHPCLWINLEYLSAESWVSTHHGLPSLHANGTSSHFFFPGFSPGTGGLLREAKLLSERDRWRGQPVEQRRFLSELGVPETALDAWRPLNAHKATTEVPAPNARLISLFCYPQAPLQALLDTLMTDTQVSVLLIPQGVAPTVTSGQRGNLHIVRVPFVSQPDYDRILWTADLNIVRGEDSFVRGLWAGRPLIWHIYPQDEETHLKKLEAWLALNPFSDHLKPLQRDWNRGAAADTMRATLQQALAALNLEHWQRESEQFCQNLSQQTDLVSNLKHFCHQKRGI